MYVCVGACVCMRLLLHVCVFYNHDWFVHTCMHSWVHGMQSIGRVLINHVLIRLKCMRALQLFAFLGCNNSYVTRCALQCVLMLV